jgi:hypothetical protein
MLATSTWSLTRRGWYAGHHYVAEDPVVFRKLSPNV